MAGLKALLRRLLQSVRGLPIHVRLRLLMHPRTAAWAMRRFSLAPLAEEETPTVEAARRAQFAPQHSEDLKPRMDWHAAQGIPLQMVGPDFFAGPVARESLSWLHAALSELAPGERMLIYAPHLFAFQAGDSFPWMPQWPDLYGLAASLGGLRVLDFNPGFDRNGCFHFLVERASARTDRPQDRTGTGQYFYLEVGDSLAIGNSAAVLSATGLRALRRTASLVEEHSFYARVPEDIPLYAGDIAMGHYGLWVRGARERGALTVLYGPGDRFRPERHDAPFFETIQTRGNFDAQYRAAHMAIMQAGGQWRLRDPYPYAGLCRWMDLPVSPAVFPRTKRRIAPPGKRVFCFIGLYDEYQKGLDIARELCRRCPDLLFIAIGCGPFGMPNCREYAAVDNRRPRFRHLATQADFLVSPARDDAQPGTVAECSSLGLLPILSETTGYVLSFPRRLNVEDLEQCVVVLRDAQVAGAEEVAGWQTLNSRYIEGFHRPSVCDDLLDGYLREAVAEYSRTRSEE